MNYKGLDEFKVWWRFMFSNWIDGHTVVNTFPSKDEVSAYYFGVTTGLCVLLMTCGKKVRKKYNLALAAIQQMREEGEFEEIRQAGIAKVHENTKKNLPSPGVYMTILR